MITIDDINNDTFNYDIPMLAKPNLILASAQPNQSLQRSAVNWLRHHSAYDYYKDYFKHHSKNTQIINTLRQLYLKRIAKMYPWLKEECIKQSHECTYNPNVDQYIDLRFYEPEENYG